MVGRQRFTLGTIAIGTLVAVAALAIFWNIEGAATAEVSRNLQNANDDEAVFSESQRKVGFDLMMPADVAGLPLLGDELAITGPDAEPIVVATYGGRNSAIVRVLTVSQSSGGFGQMGFYGQIPDDIDVGAHAGLIAVASNVHGDALAQIYWEADGIHYWITGVNISPDKLVDVSRSLEPLDKD